MRQQRFETPYAAILPALAAGLLLAAAAQVMAQTTVAGVTAGALSVDETGSAGYTTPVTVPPGIAGLQPSIALVYKSHGGNGSLGVGWSLSASSSIHRCSQTLAQDGAIHGVDFSADDRFCLDGQRLVAINGVYGADGTEYRTEIDGFARITSHGSAGTGPLSFTVESKSGQTLDYGNTTDSRLGVPGQSEIRLWSLNRVTDSSGNAMTYHYIEDLADKSYRLDRIAYAYDAAVTTAKSEVRFLYEARPDIRTSYLGGAALAMTRRLAKIETWTDTGTGPALVKDYRLTYEQSPATSRSRITAITECDAGNNCLEPVAMGWQTGTAGWQTDPAYAPPDYLYHNSFDNSRGEVIDVNGDGLLDWVRAYRSSASTFVMQTWLNTGSGWQLDAGYAPPDVIYDYIDTPGGTRGEFVDVNGDNLPDWVRAYRKASNGSFIMETHLNTGSGWQADAGYAPPDVLYDNQNVPNGKRGELVDLNGDGLVDWVRAYRKVVNGNVVKQTFINTGAGWQLDVPYTLPDVIYDPLNTSGGKRGEFADVNGDGLPDWVRAYRKISDGSFIKQTYLNTGSGWLYSPAFEPPDVLFDYSNVPNGKRGELVDLNGDGLVDWVRAYRKVVNGNVIKQTFINTGAGWQLDVPYTLPDIIYDPIDVPGGKRGELADVNGDGLPDWVRSYRKKSNGNYILQTYLNTGSGWLYDAAYTPPGVFYDGHINVKLGDLIDINGDGALDWVKAYNWSSGGSLNKIVDLNQGPAPDLLTSITDSLGRVSTLTYAPLTDDTVYTKDSDAVFPVVDIQAPLYVVKSVSSDDGLGGQKVTSYDYAGAKVHVQGRGFRGFRQMTATDQQTGIVTATTYEQVFPYTAQVKSSVKTLADGTTVKTVDNTWDQLSLNAGATVYPFVATSVSEDYEINDGLGNLPVVSRSASAVFDIYGNPTSLTTTTSGGGETFTETVANTYTNDTANWFLGLLTRSEVTRSRGATP